MLKQDFMDTKGGPMGSQSVYETPQNGPQIDGAYRCNTCNASFCDPNTFMDHMTHGHAPMVQNTLLRCPSCPMSFDRTQTLKDHMTVVHNSVPTFSVHAQPLRPNDQQNLAPQMVSTSPNPEVVDIHHSTSASGPEGLYCTLCKNPFANKYSLMKHLRSTKCKMEDETMITTMVNLQLTCGKCSHQFGSVNALTKHLEGQKCGFSRGNIILHSI